MGDDTNNSNKAQVLAFDREKRVYKDAYVDNFRKVRHFPALATIGTGRSDGESIILVQEQQQQHSALTSTSGSGGVTTIATATSRRALEDVPSRLLPPDSLEAMFETTPPLSSFRSAVLCKHTNARLSMGISPFSATSPTAAITNDRIGDTNRYALQQAAAFKPPCPVEAKNAIQRKIAYDPQAYSDKSPAGRSSTVRDGMPQWSYNNPARAKEEIRTKKYFNVPLKASSEPIASTRKSSFARTSRRTKRVGTRRVVSGTIARASLLAGNTTD